MVFCPPPPPLATGQDRYHPRNFTSDPWLVTKRPPLVHVAAGLSFVRSIGNHRKTKSALRTRICSLSKAAMELWVEVI